MLPSIPYVDPPGMALQIQFLPAGPLEKAGSSPRSYRILFSLGSVGYGSGACISALFISSWLCLVELKNCGPFISSLLLQPAAHPWSYSCVKISVKKI